MIAFRRRSVIASAALLAAPAFVRTTSAQTAPAPQAQTQAPGFYRFKVGSFTVTTVHDGFFVRLVEGTVVNAPLTEVQAALRDGFLPTDRLFIPINITFLDTGRDLVVFDSGVGVTAPGRPFGHLIANMQAAGIDPTKITRVVMSHFHPDHVNGLQDSTGAAAFPNA